HRVWCVDGTDVRMLREPFDIIQPGRLYTGYEPTTCANEWVVKNHPDAQIQSYLEEHRNDTLLNAGLLGGVRDVVMSFCHRMTRCYYDDWQDFIMGWETYIVGVGDMGAFQVVAGGFEVSTGPQVCTVFKQFENDNGVSIWAHKLRRLGPWVRHRLTLDLPRCTRCIPNTQGSRPSMKPSSIPSWIGRPLSYYTAAKAGWKPSV